MIVRKSEKYYTEEYYSSKFSLLQEKRKYKDVIEVLKKEAIKGGMLQNHCACILKNNKIISVGLNKYLLNNGSSNYSIHAEQDAIINMKKKYKINKKDNLTLIVIRIDKEMNLKNSRPCKRCCNIIEKYPFNKVVYSF